MSELRPADFSSLGFMPCPGDVEGAEDVAKVVRRTARALSEICHVLHGTGPGDWKGKAAEAFREKFDDDFRPKMDEARDSFGMAATALEGWAEYMRVEQATARQLEREAEDAERELSKALRRLAAATDDEPPAEGSPDRYRKASTAGAKPDRADEEGQRREAQGAVDDASVQLEDVRRRARSLADDYRAEGQMVANRLRGAMEIAPDEPGLFDKIADTISDLSGSFGEYLETVTEGIAKLADDVIQWVEDHAANIAAIGDVFAAVSAVLGAVSMAFYAAAWVTRVPHLALVGGAIGQAAAGTATIAFAAHSVARIAGADVSDRTLAQDAVGAVPFGANVRFIGNTGQAIARSSHASGASNLGLADSWLGLYTNPQVFENFVPKGNRQKAEMFLPGGAGAMLVGFENAWKSA
ncbi:putative T7SS-secreted protein [Streptomyces phytophilus]|uniref:putative T7SS-secreted protein n=1 Tax=Streptomyces phytophilus TaxID=722715 RepID=UPI0015F10A32|nr:WXG100 family type VII secretion target [Streptomyces phytophilus]